MMATSLSFAPRRVDPRTALQRAWGRDRPLTILGVAMVVTLAATLVGLAVDDRVITGAPAWLKPAKFALSIAIYAFTLIWLLGFVRGHRRLVGLIGWGTALALLVEELLIAGQVVRGTTSHFNAATSFDANVFRVMGASIVIVWLLNLAAAILLIRQRLADPAFAWSLRLGVLIAFVGMGIAFLMIRETPEQRAASAAGELMTVSGGHAVGVLDGGSGLPVVGWSTNGGDLRVPHFFGLHGLQLLPLLGWLLLRFGPDSLTAWHRLALVWIAGLTYLGWVLVLTWQALRGESIVAPDALTVVLLATGIAVAFGVGGAVVAHAHRRRRPPVLDDAG